MERTESGTPFEFEEYSKDKTQSDYKHLYKKMRLMCDNVPDLIWAKDLNRNYTFANRELCTNILFTNDVNEPIGKPSKFFFDRIRKEKPENKQWYTIGDLSDHSDEFVYKFHKPIQVVVSGYVRGRFIELELQKAPFFDENQNFIGLVGSGHDITKRRKIEKDLRFNKERLQLAIDGANIGIWDWRIDKGKLYIDQKWVSFFGFTAEEFNDDFDFLKSLIHPDDIEEHDLKMRNHFINETPTFEHTFRVRTKDNIKYVWIKSIGTVVERDMTENPKRMVGIHQDVSKVVEQEIKLKHAMIQAKESDRLKTAFLANLSHEIRTPLNSILGFTRFLISEDDLSPENKKEYMDIVESSSEGFLQIINNIINIAKVESGVFQLDKKEFDLRELSIQTIEKLQRQYQYSEKIHLKFSPEPDSNELFIHSDKDVLEQIIYSLLSNAVKFTLEGEVELGYELIDNERLFIYVKDSGIGIDLKHEHVIFQPFRQLTESFNREYGGAGLGLAIAYSMTEILDGKLWFESEKEKGTIFYVYIPLG